MPKVLMHALVWTASRGLYELHPADPHLSHVLPGEEKPWVAWLATSTSFSFQGQCGRLTVRKEVRPRGEGYWYAYHSHRGQVRKRYLGRTAALTLTHLEAVAQALGTDPAGGPARAKADPSVKNPLSTLAAMEAGNGGRSQRNLLLRRARLERGWSQRELADLIDAPHALTINRWENGVVFPGPGYREKLCQLFEKSLADLGLVRQPALFLESPGPQGPIIDPALPVYLARQHRLIGRGELLREITNQLLDPLCHQLALCGLPGIGKTMLATVLATQSQIQRHFPDGVLWADLGPRSRLSTILIRWSKLLGMSSTQTSSLHSEEQWIDLLRETIGMKRILVVIDDAWTIEEALACRLGGPHCSYLLTTRSPEIALRFAGTQVFQVPELEPAHGRELLTTYVPMLKEGREELVSTLVQAVGGLPLALKLMGIHLMIQARHHQPRRFHAALTRLQQATERLRLAEPQAGLERDRRLPPGTSLTLQAIIELSETMLSTQEQQALFALSVFPPKPHSFSEEAALAVTAAPPEVLDRLVDSGLVEVSAEARYQLHQTIADYATTRRTDSQVLARLQHYVWLYIKQHHGQNDLLDQESHLIFVALEMVHHDSDFGVYVQWLLALSPYLRETRPFTQAEQYLQQAYHDAGLRGEPRVRVRIAQHLGASLRDQGRYREAEAVLREGLQLASSKDPKEEMELLALLGTVLTELSIYQEAKASMDEALIRAEQLGDQRLLGRYTAFRATVEMHQGGDLALIENVLLKAQALYQPLNVPRDLAFIHLYLLEVHRSKGNFEQAYAYAREAERVARTFEYQDLLLRIQVGVGELLYEQGAYARAKSLFEEARTLAHRMRSQRWIFSTLFGSSRVALKMGDIEQALAYQQEAGALLPISSTPEKRCDLLLVQILVALAQHDPAQARTLAYDALQLAREVQLQRYCCEFLIQLGMACQQAGDFQEAQSWLQEGLRLAQTLAMPRFLGEVRLALGEHFLLQAAYRPAKEQFEEVMRTIPHDYQELIARAHAGLGSVARGLQQYQEARRQGLAALALFEQMQHFQQQEMQAWLASFPE
jgi:tetratricopeptide (TPR) repeat protein/transcriptional regulator with XRE-family HTH domain